jgi:hypothetical protein
MSGTAVAIHAAFLLLLGLLASSVLAGDRGPAGDYPLGLALCAVAYPAALLLAWLKTWVDGECLRSPPRRQEGVPEGHDIDVER